MTRCIFCGRFMSDDQIAVGYQDCDGNYAHFVCVPEDRKAAGE